MQKYEFLSDLMKDINKPIVFELGANFGDDTIDLYDLLNPSILYAFEANPNLIEIINNKVANKNVVVYNKIISDVEGLLDFYIVDGENRFGSSSIYKLNNNSRAAQRNGLREIDVVKVEAITLDAFCKDNNIDHIDFIWSDIQGAEPNMLRGAAKILANTKYIIMECIANNHYHDLEWEGWTRKEICSSVPGNWSFLKRFGQDLVIKNDDLV